jgi:hypothetical protein
VKSNPMYDSTLQMFKDPPAELNWERLCFERAIAESSIGEHSVAGDPSGPVLEHKTDEDCRVLIRARMAMAAVHGTLTIS